jgi:hypothetical protein
VNNKGFLKVLDNHPNVKVVTLGYLDQCIGRTQRLQPEPLKHELCPASGVTLFLSDTVKFEPNRLLKHVQEEQIWVTCATVPEVDEKLQSAEHWDRSKARLWSNFTRYTEEQRGALAPGQVYVRLLTPEEQSSESSTATWPRNLRTSMKMRTNPKFAAFARTFFLLTDSPEEYAKHIGTHIKICTFDSFLEDELPKILPQK